MELSAKRKGPSLRQGLDRDVYQVLKKLEDANDGKPFKTTSAVYEAIKRSNSSLSRQKKKPLEDAIDRVLQFRKHELGESSDSEAELEEPPSKHDDGRFLLNKQMTMNWHKTPTSTPNSQDTVPQPTSDGLRTTKKRRVEDSGEDRAKNGVVTPKGAVTDQDAAPTEKQEKALTKKASKLRGHSVMRPSDSIQIAGVKDIYTKLWKQARRVLVTPDYFGNYRKVPGILLSGPTGIGKKTLIKYLASKLDVPIVALTGCFEDPERMEKSLNDAIEDAMNIAPCIMLIENLDWYMPKAGGTGPTEGQRRNLNQFTRHMERIGKEQDKSRRILAMATTTRLTDVDPLALNLGMFERTIQMRLPDHEDRLDILKLLTQGFPLTDTVELSELARHMHGFVAADIVNLLTLALDAAAERKENKDESRGHCELPTDQLPEPMELEDEPSTPSFEPSDFSVSFDDFKFALKEYVPSLRKEGFTVVPNVSWDQVGGLEAARDQLNMSIIGPIKDPELYRQAGLGRPAGCLLWGPPGCGKTLVAQAVANEAQASFILINGPELLNKYVGESERAVRELFNRARSSTPCILFFDEMDSLVPKRDNASTEAGTRVVNALLTELDGVQDRTGVYVIGTTNRPDMIDPAMLRPGRLNVRLFIDLPTADERVDILRAIYRTNHPTIQSDAELESIELVARDPRCNDFSGADLGGLHVNAAQSALRRFLKKEKPRSEIDEVDWERALATTKRSVSNPETYRKLEQKMGKS
ncbi:Ff.00g052730.m01.CDS01 [Fusarium sp. VM40]|nr:Ff.00g052730.m01.CDS01 [Fusarium sp. VM40]